LNRLLRAACGLISGRLLTVDASAARRDYFSRTAPLAFTLGTHAGTATARRLLRRPRFGY
jgi:hypothetical protein